MERRSDDTLLQRVGWGAVGAAFIVGGLLLVTWLDGVAWTWVGPLLDAAAAFVGITPAQPVLYGLLAAALFALPRALLLVAAAYLWSRGQSGTTRLSGAALGLVVVLSLFAREWSVISRLSPSSFIVYEIAWLAFVAPAVFVAYVLLTGRESGRRQRTY